MSVDGFLAAVAARTAAPGGGGVAAFTGAAAAALVSMAARFSDQYSLDLGGPEPNSTAETTIDIPPATAHEIAAEIAAEMDNTRAALLAAADADADAYGRVLAAYKMPSDHPARTDAIRTALLTAVEIPTQIVDDVVPVGEYAAVIAEHGNPNLRGDARTAAALAVAAARSAAELVRINVAAGSLDETLVQRVDQRVEALIRRISGW